MKRLSFVLLALAAGCASGEVRPLPMLSDQGNLRKVGTDAKPGLDAGAPEASPADGPVLVPAPASQQVVITEIMANPAAVLDSKGEWLELYNAGTTTVDLGGCTLRDEGNNQHLIKGPLLLDPKQYLVLGNNKNSATNGGVKVGYAYSGYYLANNSDQVLLEDPAGALVDRVAYDSSLGWSMPMGASISLKDPTLDRSVSANWCVEQSAWAGSAGDRGTPGAPPLCQ